LKRPRRGAKQFDIIVVGTSLGGLNALRKLLSGLPRDFPAPVAVVQHRHKASNEALTGILQRESEMRVTEAEDRQPIEAGRVYLAPADYHLFVERGTFTLSVDAAELYSRPSIDVLFESAADAYGEGVIGVVMTGANADGARGAREIKKRGGVVVVQDPATAEAPAMPQATIDAVQVDQILPLEGIAPFLLTQCQPIAP
jgi:two-component system, chemotaxis family, protein-glutamate methylesterase/glutaminase